MSENSEFPRLAIPIEISLRVIVHAEQRPDGICVLDVELLPFEEKGHTQLAPSVAKGLPGRAGMPQGGGHS